MTLDTDKYTDLQIMALTLWGEARGEGRDGIEGVASVILNRIKSGITWWGNDIRTVCLKPFQFTCWLKGDPNRSLLVSPKTLEDPIFDTCLSVATEALAGNLADTTGGADSYKRSESFASWAKDREPVATIGKHAFYKTIAEWQYARLDSNSKSSS